ncbi:hypothetical protein GCM10023170_060770 [Phytohabitans houttuyneae]
MLPGSDRPAWTRGGLLPPRPSIDAPTGSTHGGVLPEAGPATVNKGAGNCSAPAAASSSAAVASAAEPAAEPATVAAAAESAVVLMERGARRRSTVAVGFGLKPDVVVVPAANGRPSWSSRHNGGDRHDPRDQRDEEKILHVITSGRIVREWGNTGRWAAADRSASYRAPVRMAYATACVRLRSPNLVITP